MPIVNRKTPPTDVELEELTAFENAAWAIIRALGSKTPIRPPGFARHFAVYNVQLNSLAGRLLADLGVTNPAVVAAAVRRFYWDMASGGFLNFLASGQPHFFPAARDAMQGICRKLSTTSQFAGSHR